MRQDKHVVRFNHALEAEAHLGLEADEVVKDWSKVGIQGGQVSKEGSMVGQLQKVLAHVRGQVHLQGLQVEQLTFYALDLSERAVDQLNLLL